MAPGADGPRAPAGPVVTSGLPPGFSPGMFPQGPPAEGGGEPPPDLPTARANLTAARTELAAEIDRLEASARAALDVKARAKENKLKLAAGAGGLAFLAVGGPKRVIRRARWYLTGREERPKGLLPKDIDQLLDRISDDNETVRRSLEYDFAQYLKGAHPQPKSFLRSTVSLALQGAIAGSVSRALEQALDRVMRPPAQRYDAELRDVKAREAAEGQHTGSKGS